MLTLLLTACLAVALQGEPVLLQHAKKHTFSLGPDNPVLEGVGPSRTFRYELEADDSVIFLWAASQDADLVLRARFGARAASGQPDSKPSGAAALFAARKRVETHEDEDSGGGTTPYLRLERKDGGSLTITVAAKHPATKISVTIHCFEARETAATRAAAAAAAATQRECERLAESGEQEAARKTLAEALETIFETEGAPLSDAIHQRSWGLGFVSYRSSTPSVAHAVWSNALDWRSRTLPRDHPDLQVARSNLALTLSTQGDLCGARALQEQVLEIFSRTLPEDHPDLQAARGNLAATMRILGDFPVARALREQVLEIRSRTLSEDHPDLQRARLSMADTLFAQGDLPGARALEEQVLEILSRTLREDHPDLQNARTNLALTLFTLGDLLGARALQEQVLGIHSRMLPEDHPDLQTARSNLAATIAALGDVEGARVLQEQVLETFLRTLPWKRQAKSDPPCSSKIDPPAFGCLTSPAQPIGVGRAPI